MALKVEIEGIGEIIAEGFAEQETLEQIRVLLEKMEKLDATQERRERTDRANQKNTDAKSKNTAFDPSAAKGIDELVDSVNDLNKETSILTGALSSTTSAFADTTKSLLDGASNSDDAFGTLGEVLNTVVDRFSSLIQAVGESTSAIPFIGGLGEAVATTMQGVLAAGAAAAGMVLAQVQNLVEQTDQLVDMSAFLGQMETFKNIANDSGLTIEQFTNVVKSSREQLYVFGGTIENGAKKLSEATATLNQHIKGTETSYSQMLRTIGFSKEMQAQATANFLAEQAMVSRQTTSIVRNMHESEEEFRERLEKDRLARGLSVRDQAEAISEYMTNLTKLSKLTGKSVDELQAERLERLRDVTLMSARQAVEANGGSVEAMQVLQATTKEMSPAIEKLINEILSFGGIVSEESGMIAESLGPVITAELSQLAHDIRSGTTTSVESVQDRLQQLTPDLEAAFKDSASITRIALTGANSKYVDTIVGLYSDLNNYVNAAGQQIENNINAANIDPSDNADDLSKNIGDARNAMQDWAVAVQELALEGAPMAGELVKSMSDMIGKTTSIAKQLTEAMTVLNDDSLSWSEKTTKLDKMFGKSTADKVSEVAQSKDYNLTEQQRNDLAAYASERRENQWYKGIGSTSESYHASVALNEATGFDNKSKFWGSIKSIFDENAFRGRDYEAERIQSATELASNDEKSALELMSVSAANLLTYIEKMEQKSETGRAASIRQGAALEASSADLLLGQLIEEMRKLNETEAEALLKLRESTRMQRQAE